MLANKLNITVWLFYGFAVVALATTGFFFAQAANDTAHFVGFGVFAFLAMLSIAVGNALRLVGRRLREVDPLEQLHRLQTSQTPPGGSPVARSGPGHLLDGERMWRIYVGGLLTGIAIGGFVAWCVAWTIVPDSARAQISVALPLILVPFVLAGERLRIRGSKPA